MGPSTTPHPAKISAALAVLLSFIFVGAASAAGIHDVSVTVSGVDRLPIESIQVLTKIDGPVARVVLDALVRNRLPFAPGRSQIPKGSSEGTLEVGLPAGASPYLLAFGREADGDKVGSHFIQYDADTNLTSDDVMVARNEKLSRVRGARMAPTGLAAKAFRDTVSRGIDPAILEGGSENGGAFSTRIFPLEPGALHRIVLGYDVPLDHGKDGLGFNLRLPNARGRLFDEEGKKVNWEEEWEEPLSVRADIISDHPFSLPNTNRSDFIVLSGEKGENGKKEGGVRHNHVIVTDSDQREHWLEFIPETEMVPTFPELAASPLACGLVEDVYHFAASIRIPEEVPGSVVSAQSTSHVVFAVETSFSTAQNVGAIHRYGEIITKVLEENRSIEKFNLLLFDVDAHWMSPEGWMDNVPARRAEVRGMLQSVLLEGATDLLLALAEAENPPSGNGSTSINAGPLDMFLLSSGAATWGEMDPNSIVTALPSPEAGGIRQIHTYNVGLSGGNPALLRRIAEEMGGTFVEKIDASLTIDSSLAKLHNEPQLMVESIEVEGALDVVTEGSLRSLRPGQVMRLAWRSMSPDATKVQIKVADLSRDLVVEFEKPKRLTNLAVRAYGIHASAELEEKLPSSEVSARAIALYYRVAGRTASLVMLETERDYERHDILASYPFETVRSIHPAEDFRDAHAGDPRAALRRFMRDIEAAGTELHLPKATLDLLETVPESGLDFSFGTEMTTPPPETMPTVTLKGLQHEISLSTENHGIPEASYDAWTAEAEVRKKAGMQHSALRALTSLIAQRPADVPLRRDVALSAAQLGFHAAAYQAFQRIAAARPWEPMSYLQMAKSAQAAGLPDLATLMYEISLAGQWEKRFADIETVAAMLYARHLHQVNVGLGDSTEPSKQGAAFATKREPEVRAYGVIDRADLVTVITWNQDNTDVDLHVTEPGGEECFYGHPQTKSGGYLTSDVTDGFGPEMYIQRKADLKGAYKIDVELYSENPNRLSVPVKVLVEIFKDWGWSTEEYFAHTVVEKEGRDRETVATIEVGDKMKRSQMRVSSQGRSSRQQPGPKREWIGGGGNLVDGALGLDRVLHSAGYGHEGGEGGCATSEILLLDVIPLSIGIRSPLGEMVPLVRRGSTIPTRKSRKSFTIYFFTSLCEGLLVVEIYPIDLLCCYLQRSSLLHKITKLYLKPKFMRVSVR